MVVIVDENSGESATVLLEDQLQVSGCYYYFYYIVYPILVILNGVMKVNVFKNVLCIYWLDLYPAFPRSSEWLTWKAIFISVVTNTACLA